MKSLVRTPSHCLVFLFALSSLITSALAEPAGGFAFPAGLEKSFWKANDDSGTEIWLVSRADGSMELKGRDLASTYEGLFLSGNEPGSYRCHGVGFRFAGGINFTYASTFTLKEEGGVSVLRESWSATLATGEIIKGETRLQLTAEITAATD